jgi:hypothetical protein
MGKKARFSALQASDVFIIADESNSNYIDLFKFVFNKRNYSLRSTLINGTMSLSVVDLGPVET